MNIVRFIAINTNLRLFAFKVNTSSFCPFKQLHHAGLVCITSTPLTFFLNSFLSNRLPIPIHHRSTFCSAFIYFRFSLAHLLTLPYFAQPCFGWPCLLGLRLPHRASLSDLVRPFDHTIPRIVITTSALSFSIPFDYYIFFSEPHLTSTTDHVNLFAFYQTLRSFPLSLLFRNYCTACLPYRFDHRYSSITCCHHPQTFEPYDRACCHFFKARTSKRSDDKKNSRNRPYNR